MEQIFYIGLSLILSVALIGTLMTIPALYRREARRAGEKG